MAGDLSPLNSGLPIRPVCEQVVLSLAHSIWQGAMVAAVFWLVARCRLLSLQTRYCCGVASLVLLAALPVANFVAMAGSRAAQSSNGMPLEPIALVANESVDFATSDGVGIDRFPVPNVAPIDSASSHVRPLAFFFFDGVLLAYLIGVAFMAWRLKRGLFEQRRLQDLANEQVPGTVDLLRRQLEAAAQAAAARMKLRLRLQVGVVETATSAVVIGFLRPAILVNAALITGLTPGQLEQVMAHELAHVARLDPWILLIQRLIETFMFFNPAVWLVSQQVSELREWRCDEDVAREYNPLDYAATLVECAAWQSKPGDLYQLAITGSSTARLRRRVGLLLRMPDLEMPRSLQTGKRNGRGSAWLSIALQRKWQLASLAMAAGGFAALHSLQEDTTSAQKPAWDWVVPDEADFDSVAFRLNSLRLPLKDERPDGIEVHAMVDIDECRFAQWQFGDERSQRMLLMVDFGSPSPRVFLDKNRDRAISDDELLSKQAAANEVFLADVATQVGDVDRRLLADRQLAVSTLPDGRFARVATRGFAKGELLLNEKRIACRRIDNDGNGLPLGNKDDIWLDLNGDGKFDSLSERFAHTSSLEIAGQRYGVRSDAFGQELSLEPITASGAVQFRLSLADPRAQITDIQGVLCDRNGNFLPIRTNQLKIELSPGEYCIETLSVSIVDASGHKWHMNLTRGLNQGWFDVSADQESTIDLLSQLRFTAKPELVTGHNNRVKAGFLPYIYDDNGLVISDFTDKTGESATVRFEFSTPDGRELPREARPGCTGFG